MSFLQFFRVRTPKPSSYRYTPLYYNEEEEKKKRKSMNRDELSEEERNELLKEEFAKKIGRTRTTNTLKKNNSRSQEVLASKIRLWVIILLLGYIFYYILNKMDNLASAFDIIKNH